MFEFLRKQGEDRFCDNQVARLFFRMSTVTEIIEAVKRLDERQKGEFLQKLADVDFDDAWDRQIESDAASGALDKMYEQLTGGHREKNARPLDDFLDDPKLS